MGFQVQFPEFKTNTEKVYEGVGAANQAVQMGLQVDQVRNQQRAQEWDRDLKLATHFMDFANTKGATDATRADSINSANQILGKWYPGMKFPTLTPKQMPDYAPVLKAGADLIKGMQKDPSKFEFAIGEWGRHNADWVANAGKDAELSAAQESARKQVTDTLGSMGDSERKKRDAAKKDLKTPDEVLKEMFEINTKVNGMQQLDQNTANLIQMNPEAAAGLVGSRLTPEQLGQVKGMGAARMQALNEMLPAEKRLQPVTEEEAQALIKAGHSPEEVFRRTFIVQKKRGM